MAVSPPISASSRGISRSNCSRIVSLATDMPMPMPIRSSSRPATDCRAACVTDSKEQRQYRLDRPKFARHRITRPTGRRRCRGNCRARTIEDGSRRELSVDHAGPPGALCVREMPSVGRSCTLPCETARRGPAGPRTRARRRPSSRTFRAYFVDRHA
jgi:hypothetical protein